MLFKQEKYTYKNQQDTIISVPNEPNTNIVISASEMSTKIFDPIIERILCLIEDQYNSMYKAGMGLDMIILTGGLGQSTYLLNKIEDAFADKGIKVHAPPQYDQSVVRGAVELARDTSYISKRIVQKTYGVEVLIPLDNVSESTEALSTPRFVKFNYDVLFKANNFMKNNEYVEKKYYVMYPNNVFICKLSNLQLSQAF